ncbi:MAG: DNA polymerase/3'-5' exonuclease PolX [bacterium]|nr:DNA polymerase/3'-5' exonuclease PolX [bacterium]
MKNQEIAHVFENMADILELQGEISFKVNAYRKASRLIKDLQEDIEQLAHEGKLRELPGIGDALVKKITEYLDTGKINKYEEISKDVSPELLSLLNIQNLGPKTLALAHQKLNVKNIDDLTRVIDDGSLSLLPGMGQKKVENIRKGIQFFLSAQERISIGKAVPIVEEIIDQLRKKIRIEKICPAGSVRRMKETVGDIDILAATDKPKDLIAIFTALPQVADVSAAGETKASVRLKETGLQVDLRVVPLDSFGAAQQYFTGSQAHNVKLRGLAKKQSFKINEYGVFRQNEKLAGDSEKAVYNVIGLEWIPPEMREDRGEIELAAEKKLPRLIELEDIQGDLHVHSNYSDGHASIQAMAVAAQKLGYKYIAICDHSLSAKYAQGLSIDTLLKQINEIDELNQELTNFQILKGIEVDILSDGSLDYPDEILSKLDIVVASIHTAFTKSPTERILTAMENPLVDIIGHPTGRLISQRQGYEIDLNNIFKKAQEIGTAFEINSYPDRLDLSDVNAKLAAEYGIMLAINTDAHELENLNLIKFGVATARRAWLASKNILNCLDYPEILTLKKQRLSKRG